MAQRKSTLDEILSTIGGNFANIGSNIFSKASQLGSNISQGFQQLRQPTQSQGLVPDRFNPVVQIRSAFQARLPQTPIQAFKQFRSLTPTQAKQYRQDVDKLIPTIKMGNIPVLSGLAEGFANLPGETARAAFKLPAARTPQQIISDVAGIAAAPVSFYAGGLTSRLLGPLANRLGTNLAAKYGPGFISKAVPFLARTSLTGAAALAPFGAAQGLRAGETAPTVSEQIRTALPYTGQAAATGLVVGPVFGLAAKGLVRIFKIKQEGSYTFTPEEARIYANNARAVKDPEMTKLARDLDFYANQAEELGNSSITLDVVRTKPTGVGKIFNVKVNLQTKPSYTTLQDVTPQTQVTPQIAPQGARALPPEGIPTVETPPIIPFRPSIIPEVPIQPVAQFRVVEPPVTGVQPREIIPIDKTKYKGVQTANVVIRPDGTGSIAVELKPEAQGKGLGTELVKELETILKDKGVRQVEIASVPESVGFWEKQGYERTGEIAQAGLVNMQKALEPEPAGLKVEQAPEQQITVDEAKQAMGTLFSNDEIQFLTRGAKDIITPDGKVATGKYTNSIIEVVEQNGKVSEKTVYHEAFHAYTDKYADPNLKKGAIEEIKVEKGFKTIQEAEEYLADSFADFISGKQTFAGRILSFFTNLLYAIRSLIGKIRQTDQLFQDIINKKRPQGASTISVNAVVEQKPNLNLKRDVTVTDINGNKTVIPEAEALSAYELKGGKVLLKDGREYIVTKNQYENIKNNSVKTETKPFAPELAETEETIKGNPTEEELTKQGFWIQENPEGSAYKFSLMNNKNESVIDANSIETIKSELPISQYKASPVKYSQYQLPGGENYREILIQAPTNTVISMEKAGWKFEDKGQLAPGEVDLIRPDGTNLGRYGSKESAANSMQRDFGGFKSSHWDEPNVLAHIRLNDRILPNGQKVTFIEEIQSDWAGEGRRRGFQDIVAKAKITTLDLQLNTLRTQMRDYLAGIPGGGNVWDDRYQKLLRQANTITREQDLLFPKVTGVPNNPLLKNWQELTIKRALIEAVNNGSEYLSWTNGEQQAARYDLSKQVDNIEWFSNQAGRRQISIRPTTGSSIDLDLSLNGEVLSAVPNGQALVGKKLDEVLGKGLAEKIIADEKGKLSGDGLKLGGEWTKRLYDEQIPNIIKDITGQKPEVIDMGLPMKNKTDIWRLSDSYEQLTQHGGASEPLTTKNIKVGLKINTEGNLSDSWVVTNVLSDEKFKAVPASQLHPDDIKKIVDGTLSKKEKEIMDSNEDGWIKTFDLSDPKSTGQQAIRITPEIKALVKGQAPELKQPGPITPFTSEAGKTWFRENMTPEGQEPVAITKEIPPELQQWVKIAKTYKNAEEFEQAIPRIINVLQEGKAKAGGGEFYPLYTTNEANTSFTNYLRERGFNSIQDFYTQATGEVEGRGGIELVAPKPIEEIVKPEEIPEITPTVKTPVPQDIMDDLVEGIPNDPVGARDYYNQVSQQYDLPTFEELEQTASQVTLTEREIVDELKKEAGASDVTQLDQIGQYASTIRKAVGEYKKATKTTGAVDIATMTEKVPELDSAINALKNNGIEVNTMEDLADLVPRLPIWRTRKAGIRVSKSMTARLRNLIASGATPEQLLAELDNPMSATRQTLRKVVSKRLTSLVKLGLKPEPKLITEAEDVLLKTKLRAEAKGARGGFQEGKTITREELIDKFRTKITDMKQAKQDVVNYIKTNLPIGERGRFIEMVKNVNTQTGVIKAFVKIDKQVNRYERRQLIEDIKQRIIKITDSPSVDVRLKQTAISLLENVELVRHSPDKLAELKATKEYIERQFAQGQDVQMPKRVLKAIDILSKKPIEDITIRDLQTIVGELQLAENLGRFKFTSRKIEYDTEKRLKLNEVIKDAQPMEPISELRAPVGEKLSFGQKLKNRFINLANEIKRERMAITPMDVVIDMLDGGKRYTGANYRVFKATLDSDFGNFLDNLFSTKNSFAELKKKLDLKETNFERIGVYAARVQEGGVQKLLDTGLPLEEINSVKLTKNEMTMYQYMRSEMDKIKPLVDAIMVDLYNQPVGTVDNYFSFMSDFKAMEESEIVQMFGGLINEQGFRTKSPEKGFTKQRTLGTQKIKIDAEEVFLQHMENVHYLLNLGRDTKMLFEIANSSQYKEAVGDRGQQIMLDWLDLMARKGGANGAKILPIVDFFRKNVGAGILGFRLSTILIQPTALINSMSEIGSRYAIEGTTRIITSREWRRFLAKNIPEFRARGGDDPAFTELSEVGFIKKFQEKGLALMKFADLFTAGSTAGGAYLKKLNELGKPLDLMNPDPEALQYAALIIRRTQASPFFKDVPLAISRGALTGSRSIDKMFFQFQSFLLNQWSQIEHDVIRLGIKEKNPIVAARRLTWLILAVVAAAGTGIAAKEIVSGLISLTTGKVEDKDEEKNEFAERLMRDAIGVVPFVGQIVNSMYYSSLPVPVIETFSRALEGGWGLIKAKTEEGKINAAIRLTEGIGSLAGISGISQVGQVLRTGKRFVSEEEAVLNQLLRMPDKQKDKLDKEAQKIYEKIKKSPDQSEDLLTNALQTNPELYKKILDLDLNEQTGLLDIEKKIDKINNQIGNLKSGITKGAIPLERGLEAIDYLQQQQLDLLDSIKNKPSKSQTLKLPEKEGLVGAAKATEPTATQNLMMQKMRLKIQDDQAKLIAELKGETTFANNKIIYPDAETGNAKIIDLNPLLTEKTGLEKAKQQSDIYKTARNIYNLSELTDEQKNQAYNMLGVKSEEVVYDALANENSQVKATYLEDFLTGKPYEEILTTLMSNRLESVSGDMITNDATLDELVERGVISYEDGQALKKYKFTMDKQGNIKNIGSSARAKKAKKAKKITFPKLSFKKVSIRKPTPIKISKPQQFKPLQIRIGRNIPKPPSVRFTSSQFRTKMPTIRFPRMPERLSQIGGTP